MPSKIDNVNVDDPVNTCIGAHRLSILDIPRKTSEFDTEMGDDSTQGSRAAHGTHNTTPNVQDQSRKKQILTVKQQQAFAYVLVFPPHSQIWCTSHSDDFTEKQYNLEKKTW